MSRDQQTDSSKLLDLVDEETREGMVHLQDELRGLETEIQAKIRSFDNDNAEQEKKEQYLSFQEEVQKALEVIDGLASTEIEASMTEEAFLNGMQDELKQLREFIETNLQKISKITQDMKQE